MRLKLVESEPQKGLKCPFSSDKHPKISVCEMYPSLLESPRSEKKKNSPEISKEAALS